MVLLTPQWHHFFSIWSVDSLLSMVFFSTPSTVSCQSCWVILISFFMFYPNWNGPTRICSDRKMLSWYPAQTLCFFKKSFTCSDLTDHIFLSVQSWFIDLIFVQKQHSVIVIGCLLKSSWCLMYYRHRYTPKCIMVTVSNWYISTCTKYNLSCADPTALGLMKKSL